MANLSPQISHRLTHSQNLALTPAMQLKLKLWQMNIQELSQTVEQALMDNPLLEQLEDGDEIPTLESLEEGRESDVLDNGSSASNSDGDAPEGADSTLSGLENNAEMNPEQDLEAFREEGVAQVSEVEFGAENTWDVDLPRTSNLPDDERFSWEDRLTSTESLSEHLIGQLYQLMEPDDPRALLMEALIDHVDPKGFVRLDPDSSLETKPIDLANDLGISLEHLQELLDILQEFDPSGVGCFTVKESLILQLRHAGTEPDDLVVRIIQDYTELLMQRDNVKLRKALGCSEEELVDAMSLLRHLHPAPGRAFDPESERVIKPDVVVLKGEDGTWRVYLNDEGVPRLRVNGNYKSFIASSDSREDKTFIRERYRGARDFIRGLEDRNRTVVRVAKAIVELQQDFLDQGVVGLHPMVLRDVAEATGFHESTISRVVKAKTIHTPQGLFDLNYFFSASLGSSTGDDVSATVVKHKIKALIQAEDPAKPLSDETIAKLLERDGIKVARRTVNKYREEIKIPPASMRRRR